MLAFWKGCSCTRPLLDPDSFYVNSRINVCTLLESSHHHPSSHKTKFPEPPGGAREEGQVSYDGCRSALKTSWQTWISHPWSVPGWMDVHKQRGWDHTGLRPQQHRLLRAVSWPPSCVSWTLCVFSHFSDIILKFTNFFNTTIYWQTRQSPQRRHWSSAQVQEL